MLLDVFYKQSSLCAVVNYSSVAQQVVSPVISADDDSITLRSVVCSYFADNLQ